MPTFEIGDTDFLLDGRPHQVVSGALHYFRVHPEQWADRIRKARLMGLNTIETYVAWNFHAPERGRFDLDGPRDLGRFLDLVAAEGMHAIVRPGPYICAEWDNGGLPAWLLADPEVGVRRHEPRYLAAIAQYYDQLLPLVAERQVTRGGPVIAVQVENEYGAYGDDHDYLRALIAMNRERGIEVPLLSCDQADDEMQARGSVPELHRTVTFGTRAKERLELLRRHQPTGPLMCMEFWDGWFDWWGEPHHVAPAEMNAQDLDDLLALGASVNLYMFHGGTNFGFTGGANDKHTYQPITTSYDYDAPLAEHGAVTAKWHAMRDVISRYAPVPDELPADPAPAPELAVDLDRRVPFAAALPVLGEPAAWDHLPTTDELGHWTGFTLYRTRVTADDRALTFTEVRDRALVALDGEPVGVLSRTEHSRTLALPARAGELTLLVEDQGRVNYGPRIGEPKGLIGPARTATRELTDWAVTPMQLDGVEPAMADLLAAAPAADAAVPVAGPAFLRGTFDTVAGADHFLRTDGWGKGLVWVNGFLLGRYWSAGPTATLYVPGPLLRAAGNELVVLELHGAAEARVTFVPGPDLGSSEV
ncbi:beta-galactosidase family protein [Cellulomonas sp. PS-H5]|uniref:glycoside hydrolase family 35 protein n=1 Tax=Cellulomonas sp. PS-H5 TaxID=2820400 RepID=UPI001C4E54EF|nr:beta-galactosidase family protein [Cellulomonas sp. PS-H5]MBW0253542.1 beta-galactosidase [Cellulomonas sp. PS-H5]